MTEHLGWQGPGIFQLCLFLNCDHDTAMGYQWPEPAEVGGMAAKQPYRLVDDREDHQQSGNGLWELDLDLTALPDDLQGYLQTCLAAAMQAGASCAWFAFEASVDFNDLFGAATAPLVYGFARRGVDAVVALEDSAREGPAWRKAVQEQQAGCLATDQPPAQRGAGGAAPG